MPKTYTPIATQTVNSAAASVIFSSIPAIYTDLVIVGSYSAAAGAGFDVTLNNITTNTSYSVTRITHSGSSAVSYKANNQNYFALNYNGTIAVTPEYSTVIIDLLNYANTTTYKTMLVKFGNTTTDNGPLVGLWRGSTGSAFEAINRVDFKAAGGANWAIGTTFTIYGILKA
jgi:hypothetical protein